MDLICIVPDGVLFGSSTAHKAIREELVENQRLEAYRERTEKCNEYKATLVDRKILNGLYLYDILDIKKETSTPLEFRGTVR